MIYKINLDKKKEFEKWNYKQILKHILPLIIPGIIIMDFVMGFVFLNDNEFAITYPSIIKIIILSNIILLPILFISFFAGVKLSSSKLETWELNIEENYAILKNSSATTTVNFADFKKFKKDKTSITFYFKGIKRFYINWVCFNNSEQLKADLENIANRIGTFKKEVTAIEQPKTKVKFNSKFYIILIIIVIINIILRFLK